VKGDIGPALSCAAAHQSDEILQRSAKGNISPVIFFARGPNDWQFNFPAPQGILSSVNPVLTMPSACMLTNDTDEYPGISQCPSIQHSVRDVYFFHSEYSRIV
jgi:hypothetical protein